MPYFPSISDTDRVADALGKFNTGVEKPLMQLHEVLMRADDSPFTIGQRELIAAYVSGVMNDCGFCVGIHSLVAVKFGIDEGLVERLLEDIDTSGIDETMKPVLRFVRKLTLHPTQMVQADVDAVLNAGWSERALYDCLMICCTWNFMNRFVEALGLNTHPEQLKTSADVLKEGYAQIIENFNLM